MIFRRRAEVAALCIRVLRVDSRLNGLLPGNLRRTVPACHGFAAGKIFAVGFDLELTARTWKLVLTIRSGTKKHSGTNAGRRNDLSF